MQSESIPNPYSTKDYFFDVQYHANESRRRIEEAANQVAETMAEACKRLNSLVSPGKKLLREIRASQAGLPNEAERKIVANYLDAEENLKQLRQLFLDMENAAVCDPELRGNHEKKVVDGYMNGVRALETIIEILQDIRWAVMENSEDLDDIVRTESAEDFLASVG